MIWEGKEIKTTGDVCRVMEEIDKAGDGALADKFMSLMRAEGPHADTNVGYLTGYFPQETATRMRKLFDVRHPIFGNSNPTPETAYEAGLAMGRRVKAKAEEDARDTQKTDIL